MAVEALELQSRPPLTVDEFYALAERLGWDEDTRVELLDGEPVWISPVNNPHVGCINCLNRIFTRRYPETMVLVSIQNPVRAGLYDAPQPDVVLLKPRADDYRTVTATPQDILLLVEVSDTTLRTDLGRKARIYASAGISEYWVVDLNSQLVYVHRAPVDGAYQTRTVMVRGAEVSAQFAPAVQFAVHEILG
jgi:Uma2 family endonuclease